MRKLSTRQKKNLEKTKNFISTNLKGNNSHIKVGEIIDVIDTLYDYSYKKDSKILDTQFANWYCQTYLVK